METTTIGFIGSTKLPGPIFAEICPRRFHSRCPADIGE